MKIDKNNYLIIELLIILLMITTPFLIDFSVDNSKENRQTLKNPDYQTCISKAELINGKEKITNCSEN